MTLSAGTCAVCQAEVWVGVRHPRTSARVLLYPRPDSVYARVRLLDGVMPGIAFCAEHAPAIADRWGDGLVEALELAPDRYRRWYTDQFGTFLRAWLTDELHCDEGVMHAVLEQWASDRLEALHE